MVSSSVREGVMAIARYWSQDSNLSEDEERVSGFIVNFHGYQGNDELSRLQPVHQSYSTKETLGLAIFVIHNISVV